MANPRTALASVPTPDLMSHPSHEAEPHPREEARPVTLKPKFGGKRPKPSRDHGIEVLFVST